jgi:hypothetical protein
VSRAELESIVCSGAMRGKQQTYASVAERAPKAKKLSREEALEELTLRYISTRGPATVNDFTWWSGLLTADARAGIEALGSRVAREVVDGRTYWYVPGRTPAKPRSKKVELVQVYDEFAMSYRESRDLLFTHDVRAFSSGSNLLHPILLDGGLIGHWKPVPGEQLLETIPYQKINAEEKRALGKAVDRYRAFIEP